MASLTRSLASTPVIFAPYTRFKSLENKQRQPFVLSARSKFLSLLPLSNHSKMYSGIVQRRISMAQAKPNNEADSSFIPAHLMLVSDLDLTMVDHKDSSHSALLKFNCLWASEYSHSSHLVYSTGRSMHRYSELQKDVPLLTPDVLILSVGTEIRSGLTLEIDREWEKELDDGWDREVVVEEAKKLSGLQFQEEPDQGPHKVSFKVDRDNAERVQEILSARFLERGLNVKLLYSSGIDLDVLPHKAGKGQALAYVLKKLSKDGGHQRNVLVCGDSGNDIDLFTVDGVHGVIVSNAKEELVRWHQDQNSNPNVFQSSRRCAAGIIDALEHFQFGPHLSPLDKIDFKHTPCFSTSVEGSLPSPASVHREIVEFNVFMIKWLRGQVENTDDAFRRLSNVISDGARMVYPWGIESSLKDSIRGIRLKHGSLKDVEMRIWFDVINVQQLADGVYLATWQPWEQIAGGERKGYFASAILVAKPGNPNGLEWKHFHETTRKL